MALTVLTTTGTIAPNNTREFEVPVGSTLTLTFPPNSRATVTENPLFVGRTSTAGKLDQRITRIDGIAQTITCGPYPTGANVTVDVSARSGATASFALASGGGGSLTGPQETALNALVQRFPIWTAQDDQVELVARLGSLTGRRLYLEPRDYTLTSLITVGLTNCEIIGVPGSTRIVGSFGNALIRLLNINNVYFYGVEIVSTFTSAVEDQGAGVIFQYQHSTENLEFHKCGFSSPNSNSNGPSFYTTINTTDTSASLQGLLFADCDFHDFGRVGCTMMNRNNAAGSNERMKRVQFQRNRFRNVGLAGTYGIALSLDGQGRKIEVHDNEFMNCGATGGPVGIGIENTGCDHVTYTENSFDDFRAGKPWSPMSFTNHAGSQMLQNEIHCNRTVTPANARCTFVGVSDSDFSRNHFETGSGDFALFMRGSSRNTFSSDVFKSANALCAVIGSAATNTQNNKFNGCTFDNSGVAAVVTVVRFDGEGTIGNEIIGGNIIKGTGGSFSDNINNATRRSVRMEDVKMNGVLVNGYRIVNLADTNSELQEHNAQSENIRFAGTLTATRTVTFPNVERRYTIHNSTTQALTLAVSGGGTISITAGARQILAYHLTGNSWYNFGTMT